MRIENVPGILGAKAVPRLPSEYVVDSIEAERARMRLVGESRTTESGELVVWDLVLLAAERYCWRRTDWKASACTQPITRCPPATSYGVECPDEKTPESVEASIALVQWSGAAKASASITRSKAEAARRATECLDMIRGGADFAAVVERCSDEPDAIKNGGRLGQLWRGDAPPLSETAFSLCVGEVSDPVETTFGYALVFRTK